MGTKNLLLGALAATGTAVARAAPQKGGLGIVPIRNATKSSDRPTATDSSCAAACSVRYPELLAISWVPEVQIVYTTEITVGTVSTVTVTSANSTLWTSTHTVYGYVPPEYSLYMITTDESGTAVVDVGLTISDTYTFAHITYPTPYLDYPSEYHWEGVLPTHDKESSPLCATATELNNAILPQHPEYPQPKAAVADKNDPVGTSYRPLWVPVQDAPDKAWFDDAFPSESAFSYCESVPGKPAPTEFSAPKFVYDSTTIITSVGSAGIIVVQPTASGWEPITSHPTFAPTPHKESRASSWGDSTPETENPDDAPSGPAMTPHIPQIQSPASSWVNPDANQTPNRPSQEKPTPHVPSIVNPRPHGPAAQPGVTPAPAPANPTPTFTFVPTVIDGKPTATPAFVLPGSSVIASIGQTVTIDGQSTVLKAPDSVLAIVPTTKNGVVDSVPAYIIGGTSTASIGQTVTIDGKATVLATPPPYMTLLATTIDGKATSVPVYIISGSITATIGQSVTIDGQPTILPAPDIVYTDLTTTINGKQTVIPAYIISGSITATISQVVTLGGKMTTLKLPTGTESVDSQFGGPAVTSFSEPSATKSAQGAGVSNLSIPWSSVMIGIGSIVAMWLW